MGLLERRTWPAAGKDRAGSLVEGLDVEIDPGIGTETATGGGQENQTL